MWFSHRIRRQPNGVYLRQVARHPNVNVPFYPHLPLLALPLLPPPFRFLVSQTHSGSPLTCPLYLITSQVFHQASNLGCRVVSCSSSTVRSPHPHTMAHQPSQGLPPLPHPDRRTDNVVTTRASTAREMATLLFDAMIQRRNNTSAVTVVTSVHTPTEIFTGSVNIGERE